MIYRREFVTRTAVSLGAAVTPVDAVGARLKGEWSSSGPSGDCEGVDRRRSAITAVRMAKRYGHIGDWVRRAAIEALESEQAPPPKSDATLFSQLTTIQ